MVDIPKREFYGFDFDGRLRFDTADDALEEYCDHCSPIEPGETAVLICANAVRDPEGNKIHSESGDDEYEVTDVVSVTVDVYAWLNSTD